MLFGTAPWRDQPTTRAPFPKRDADHGLLLGLFRSDLAGVASRLNARLVTSRESGEQSLPVQQPATAASHTAQARDSEAHDTKMIALSLQYLGATRENIDVLYALPVSICSRTRKRVRSRHSFRVLCAFWLPATTTRTS